MKSASLGGAQTYPVKAAQTQTPYTNNVNAEMSYTKKADAKMPYTQVKKTYENPADDPEYEPERQCFGYYFFLVVSIFCVFSIIKHTVDAFTNEDERLHSALLALASTFGCGFSFISWYDPKYLGGKPSMYKAWPIAVDSAFLAAAGIVEEPENYVDEIIFQVVVITILYLIWFHDGTSERFCLCLKPWVFKKKHVDSIPQPYGAYPGTIYSGANYPVTNYPGANYQPQPLSPVPIQPPPYQAPTYQPPSYPIK